MATDEQATPDFGVRMRRLREERGVTLRQIADVTRISISALEALERNDISRLPGGIFSRAFVRSYAIEVGLDPEETVLDFLAHFPHETVIAGSPHAVELQGAPRIARRGRSFWIVLILLVLGGIVLIALGTLR